MPSLRQNLRLVSPSAVILAFALFSGCAVRAPAAKTTMWEYDVAVTPDLDLVIDAALPEGALKVDDDAQAYVRHVSRSGDRVRYRVALREMATRVADSTVAIESGGAIFSPPSAWLLRPHDLAGARFRIRVTTPEGITFKTGLRPLDDGFGAEATSLEEGSFAAFGVMRSKHVADPAFDVVIARDVALGDAAIVGWLRDGVTAVSGYFGRPPDGRAVFFVGTSPTDPTRARTFGDGGASVLIRFGPKPDLATDWVATHELVHVGFPRIEPSAVWFSEGLATYVEPVARARAGQLAPETVWKEMAEGLVRGLPKAGDQGLASARFDDFDRVYWGGALYFLLADLRIRERTNGKKSLEDAVRAVVATGANVERAWTLDRVLDVGDAATGTRVLHELANEMASQPARVDLPALFRRLGIQPLDDRAPLAATRIAITKRR